MKFTLPIAILALVSQTNGLKLTALTQDVKLTGNEMVDEQNRIVEVKAAKAKW